MARLLILSTLFIQIPAIVFIILESLHIAIFSNTKIWEIWWIWVI